MGKTAAHMDIGEVKNSEHGGGGLFFHFLQWKAIAPPITPNHSMKRHRESATTVCERPSLKRPRQLQCQAIANDDVGYLQAFLRAAGFLPRSAVIDGIFGRTTEAAVRSFQRANKLPKTGTVDPRTWQTIERYQQLFLASPATAEPPPQQTPKPASLLQQDRPEKLLLRRGAGFEISPQQQAVYYLQKLLQRGLFIPETAKLDGKFGRQTENGVKFFQVRQKLVADGIVGLSTWEALEKFVWDQEAIAKKYADLQHFATGDFQASDRKYPILHLGDGLATPQLHASVRYLQRLLQRLLSLEHFPIDGHFGSQTEQAVRRFQMIAELTIDGVVGAQTWMTLLNQWVEVYLPLRPLKSCGDRLIASLENYPHQDAARKTIPMLLETCQRCGIIEPTQVAYILATAGHAGDFGASLVEPTPDPNLESRRDLGNIQPGDGLRYQGRGFVKIAGRLNYTRWGDRTGVNLVDHPDFAAEPHLAAIILVLGLRDGSFTGQKLDDYLNGDRQDFYHARRIVADLDPAAAIIAQSAIDFLKVLH
ncbi:peptidoglycan-binding protein [Picosynechococcus sp. PCC 73109]|uniref:peptidoglycan-binding protein n=2 Tax=Picosynechococcus sp. PCC 73109 TaxID=374982 RepID=UPI0012ED4229